jgi:hypothetical protein
VNLGIFFFFFPVYVAERLAPPTSISEIKSAYKTLFDRATDAKWWRSTLESGEWKRVAVYAAEAYGIFTIGEMIGRRHVVGYVLLSREIIWPSNGWISLTRCRAFFSYKLD